MELGTDLVDSFSAKHPLSLGVLGTRPIAYLPCTRHLLGAGDMLWDNVDKNPCPHGASLLVGSDAQQVNM